MSANSAFTTALNLNDVDLFSALLQGLLYVGSITAVGSILLMLSIGTQTTSAQTESYFWKQSIFGAILLIIVEPIRLGQLLLNLFDQEFSLAFSGEGFFLLTEISTGQAGLIRIFAALLLLVFAFRQSLGLAIIPAAFVLFSYLLTGHTASFESEIAGPPPFMLSVFLLIHILLVHWWIAVIWPLIQIAKTQDPSTGAISHKFGQQAVLAVPILLFAGGVLLIQLIQWKPDLTQGYQAWFLIKLVLVGCILIAAALHKIRLAKHLRTPSDFKTFAYSLRIELGIATLILAATSLAISVGLDM